MKIIFTISLLFILSCQKQQHQRPNVEIDNKGNLSEIKPLEININYKRFGVQWTSSYPMKELTGVELYYSLNKGKTWKLYSTYKPNPSPLPVIVKEDGTYSFYTRALSKPSPEPKPLNNTLPKLIVHINSDKNNK